LPKHTAQDIPAEKRVGRRTVNRTQEDYTSLARNLVLRSWAGIIQGLIDKALAGGYQQTKLLLDLCELSKADAKQAQEKDKQQLCDVLLSGLRISLQRADNCAGNHEPTEKPISLDDNDKHKKL
jgi:hypothetical protein